MDENSVLLLLSGGKDSALCLELLRKTRSSVTALCISGQQKVEESGAREAAQKYGVELIVVSVPVFDELTWNPIKLIFRDVLMGIILIYICKKRNFSTVATGVKSSDISNPKLFWLGAFLKFSQLVLKLFRIELMFPLG